MTKDEFILRIMAYGATKEKADEIAEKFDWTCIDVMLPRQNGKMIERKFWEWFVLRNIRAVITRDMRGDEL